MAIMIACNRCSTSSRDHDSRIEFWLISSPDVATPPALDALPGAYRMRLLTNSSAASGVLGMLDPSVTSWHPFFNNDWASASLISFCVALGKAHWHGRTHGRFPSRYCAPNLAAYS